MDHLEVFIVTQVCLGMETFTVYAKIFTGLIAALSSWVKVMGGRWVAPKIILSAPYPIRYGYG